MSDEAKVTVPMTLAGRQIMVKAPTLGQILVLHRTTMRMIKQAESDEDDQGKALTSAITRTLDFIDTLIIDEDDRQFVEDQMLAGKIDWQELMAILAQDKDANEPDDDQAPKPVRKAAPKKSPKAARVAPVKATTAAARGRAKR